MNFEKFTLKTQEVLQNAHLLAQSSSHPHIDTAHILKAIIQ